MTTAFARIRRVWDTELGRWRIVNTPGGSRALGVSECHAGLVRRKRSSERKMTQNERKGSWQGVSTSREPSFVFGFPKCARRSSLE